MTAIPERGDLFGQLEDALKQIDLNTMGLKLPEPSKEDREMAAMAAMLFSQPAGQRVLEWLRARTIDAERLPMPLGVDPMQAYAWAQRREGQNDTYWLIIGLLKMADQPQEDGK